VDKENAVQFPGTMLHVLPLEISPMMLNIHPTATEEAEATENAAVDQSIGTRLQG